MEFGTLEPAFLFSGTDDSSGLYLVNFERKAFEERRKSDDSDQESDHDVPSASSHADDGDWVEYTDVLGRTRKCLRQDLPNFVAADEKLKERRRDDQDGRYILTPFFMEKRICKCS